MLKLSLPLSSFSITAKGKTAMSKKTSVHLLEEADAPYGEIVLEPAGTNMVTVENYHRSANGILTFQSPAMSIGNVFISDDLVPLLFKLEDWETLKRDKKLPKSDGGRYRLVELIDYFSHWPKLKVKEVRGRELSMVV